MLLLTTETLPSHLQIEDVYPIVLANQPIKLTQGLLERMFDKGSNPYDETFALLAKAAPSVANAIIGIKISTTTQAFQNGAYLYVTLIGTPIRYSEK